MSTLAMGIDDEQSAAAAATVSKSLTGFVPRITPSAVITTVDCASTRRFASASAEKPPKTTEWTAPMRAHASIAMGSCGTIGMKIDTLSPGLTPCASSHEPIFSTSASICAYVHDGSSSPSSFDS